jgi:uncharacterized membrane protein YeaQ/YmgE (transglycosylase-associated protein family)
MPVTTVSDAASVGMEGMSSGYEARGRPTDARKEINMSIGEIFGFLLIGCIVGPLARFIVPGDDPMPIWMTIVLGAVGAFLGGWLLAEVITPDNKGVPWIAAILAAAALVVLARLVRRGTTGSTHRQLS